MSQPKKLIIGITGGIGSGKTAATNIFQQLGIDVVDADIVARDIVKVGSPVLDLIVKQFGKGIILADGSLNRAMLRQQIFSDNAQKLALNAIMHPAIRAELLAQLDAATSDYVLLSAPLLFENGLEKYVDKVIVVDVDESVQMRRASDRDGVEPSQIEAIINSQLSRHERKNKADFIIDNSGSLLMLNEQVKAAHIWAKNLII
ncbi:dephospho-CoA kinase [Psychrosphaera sp. B3R10]|uniref:Dephospho-CoA kinase n=1 Tax=Psychrosphaera algicola TaxID=3023714 RepID=A0ABT5FCX3_9GAMM|nr:MULTISPECIES: dephospho-CoA kinase [unclassified Psychrosphaera]MBU2882507.1 dephospho-CoA kinase [Psychrosphaera sp. I2R16]MBU2989475.1 dephospho-CoA kinase [Psychrosphaera sp. B3R10]MDC2889377.1 dephospho-CoA kinase [Psychrosphaera sp. G1-22]MDO6718309.1 dephospho-CoA kinase [Psychrosphaera sp. 1_MG-2023]